MTEHELRKVPFHLVMHLNLATEHTCSYVDESRRLGFCDHTPVKTDIDGMQEFGKSYRHYRIDDKVYKSYKEFIEALKDFTL